MNRLAVIPRRTLKPALAQLLDFDVVVRVQSVLLVRSVVQGLQKLDHGGSRHRLPAWGLVLQKCSLDRVGPNQDPERADLLASHPVRS
jgi:hypothetical protein